MGATTGDITGSLYKRHPIKTLHFPLLFRQVARAIFDMQIMKKPWMWPPPDVPLIRREREFRKPLV